jgi:asparagine synthase (glutamine-hydrolysing)
VERWWRLDYGRKRPESSAREVGEEVRAALRRAVRRRMVSDVPLGAFLSGGVDSSAVVAAMAESAPGPVATFSIGFEDESHDELPYARRIAEEFGTEHHELTVRPSAIDVLPAIVRHYGEPFADSSAIPSFYLARLARRHVTVALNGDGGDESFAGYQRYTTNLALARADRLPRAVRRGAADALVRLPAGADPRAAASRVRRLAAALPLDARARYVAQMTWFADRERGRLYTREHLAGLGAPAGAGALRDAWDASAAPGLLDRMLDVDVATYLPGDLLAKMDIATMASSLEARSPLLDHEIMELAAALPERLKARGMERKIALRAALRGWVPDEILDAPKRGFQVPLAAWLRGELAEPARDVLLDATAAARGIFRPEAVRAMLDEHAAGRADHAPRIWSLLVLELWRRDIAAGRPAVPVRAVA